ncbi:tetratricopeptide repeat protein [Plebeiibacterium marinum]|uniref:Uncharacterized protein n=1 Tax=Plebeiibacterium marinum TaxID=2992111 RepID=A0AAE3MC27_9BACT|nr:tetratricopeptide repeat protein [Plebeiobacterium marinum]MCW3805016.1 hypothetical protein [Plebeiobacterium marinum]
MNRISASILFAFFAFVLCAQNNNNSKMYHSAVQLAESRDYVKAIDLFKRVVDIEPENINAQYNIGHCYLNLNNGADSASVYLNNAKNLLKKDDYNTELGLDIFMALAKSYQLQYRFQDAIDTYTKVQGFISKDLTELNEAINHQIEVCNNGIVLMKNPVKLEVQNLGENVNSKYDDHSPLVTADESLLLFTSKRISSYSTIMDDGQFTEKIFASSKDKEWKKSEIIKSIVKKNSHESGVCLSADGTELYMLISNIDGQDIYVSNFDGETWSEPFKLPQGINSRFNETHASINADKSTLFFTSDRKGGYGGLDIYMVRKLPNGEWGTPKNLGNTINTPYDEETPMIHYDGKTLYFSSEGHNSMGNFDIFYSKMNNDSSWTKPVNMGYPINTPDDDFFFTPTVAENKAYMASSRFEDNYGGSDLYLIEYEEPFENRLAVIKGQLKNTPETAWDNVKITVKENGTNNVIGEYKPHPETGKYLLILETEKSYDIAFSGQGVETKNITYNVEEDMAYHRNAQPTLLEDLYLNVDSPKEDNINIADKTSHQATVVDPEKHPYTVQFVTLKELLVDLDRFSIDVNQIKVFKCKDGNYRYVFGAFENFRDAKNAKKEVIKATGYDDPFVRYFWQLNKMKTEE